MPANNANTANVRIRTVFISASIRVHLRLKLFLGNVARATFSIPSPPIELGLQLGAVRVCPGTLRFFDDPLAVGGTVRGGIYGTAAKLGATPDNPTLENNGADVRHETDFRSVYARVIESWLGADPNAILGADFRSGAPNFL